VTTVAELAPEPVSAPVADSGPPAVQAVYAQAARELLRPAVAEPRIRPTAIPAFIPARAFSRTAKRSKFVVQLGAFRSATQVERAWSKAQHRYGFQNGQQPLSTTVRVDGIGTMHRLSVSGFGSQEAAQRACQSIKARNGVCFVRTIAGDAPVQWASRSNRKA
jgi:cell division septation protein DedD